MARFFVDKLPVEGTEYELTGENAAHAKVLRLNPGEVVTLCDGRGSECACVVGDGLRLTAGAAARSETEPAAKVSVYIAFPKADKAEHVIQKATELGAAEIVLFPTRFCVSRPDDRSLGKKLERWQKIARSAAEQSRRGVIPPVRALDSYAEALAEAAKADVPILFYENEAHLTLHDALAELGATPHPSALNALTPTKCRIPFPQISCANGNKISLPTGQLCPQGEGIAVSLMTGAEGGFAREEIERAEAAGLKICTLGPRILRCETAPLAGLTAVMYALGEL